MIELVIVSLGRGRYAAYLGDRCIIANAREPFFAAARVLLAECFSPDLRLIMRHKGSKTIALRSTIGAAAKLTVEDTKYGVPRIVRLRKATETTGAAPPIEFNEERLPK